ncbi:hypothetical protein BH10ACI3_BH10ACI3_10190 [soil metagenome]
MFTKRENEETLLFVLRAAGRVLSLAVLFVLLMFYLSEGGNTEIAFREVVGLLFFPVGLVIGLMVGWRNEMAGGMISMLSVAAFYVIYGSVLSGTLQQGWAFLVFAIPGLLFLAYGVLDRIWFHPGHHHASV